MADGENGQIPAEIYQPFVRSLYADRAMLAVGMLAHVATGLLIWLKLRDPFYIYCAIAIFVIWVLRIVHMSRFDLEEEAIRPRREIFYWEVCYVAFAGAVTLTLGVMSGYSLYVSRDPFAELAAISVTLGTMLSAVGRNYGSKRTVDVIAVAALTPIVLGLLLVNDLYSALLACLIIPYVLLIRSMSKGVREFLRANLMAKREIAVIAERFDTALNNMSHGLIMLDADNRVVVANRRAAELLEIDQWDRLRGCSLKAAMKLAVHRSILTSDQADSIERRLSEIVKGVGSRALVRFSEDLYLQFTAKRRPNDGAVLIFEDVTGRVKAEEKIIHMARYDSLTGLPNRAYFAELVEAAAQALPADEQVALCILDLDDFKDVNDTKGHPTGDRLLCAMAARLRDTADGRVTLSRYGGDEFVLFIRGVKGREDVEMLLGRVLESLRGCYFINGNKLFVGISAGIVISTAGAFDLETLHVKADLALYESKRSEKNILTLFAAEMDERYNRRQRLKSELREAIAGSHFSVVYQPMLTVDGLKIACCEALARWNHPELGTVPPSIFVALAEEMGIVGDLTRQMVMTACRDCMSWHEDVAVSVNLSALDLANIDILALVEEALERSGLAVERLQIEVTESAFVRDRDKAQAILTRLRDRGVAIAIDDFGTGYSSLSYLNSLPLNKVKIDRAFVSDIATSERQFRLLSGIVDLSHAVGLDVVLEGVETEEQMQALRRVGGIDLVQGFLFGSPVPNSAIVELTRPRAADARASDARAIDALRASQGG